MTATRHDKACGAGWISDKYTCHVSQISRDRVRGAADQDERALRYAQAIANQRHGHHPFTQRPMQRSAAIGEGRFLKILADPNQPGQQRGFYAMPDSANPIALPHRKGNFEYASTGPIAASVTGRSPSVRAVLSQNEPLGEGKFWTVNAFRRGSGDPLRGQWKWMGTGIQTANIRSSAENAQLRQQRTQVGDRQAVRDIPGTPAILSVSAGAKGEHFYALNFDTGNSPGILSYNPKHTSEPRNFIGGQGQVVLGKPVGVIQTGRQQHPVYDRVQVRRQPDNENTVVRTR